MNLHPDSTVNGGRSPTGRVLVLAPQPFFQERGTPIAVRLLLEELAACGDDLNYDLLVYQEGETLELPPSITLHRVWLPPGVRAALRNIGPGASIKKLLCDAFFSLHALFLIVKAKLSRESYCATYAVEEAVFISLFCKILFRIPYVYDMDSLLARQLVERWKGVKRALPFFAALERLAMRQAAAVVPVCQALADEAAAAGAVKTLLLPDIDLSVKQSKELPTSASIRTQCGIPDEALVAMYVGNMEHYQGIDLLLKAFHSIVPRLGGRRLHLVLVGGTHDHIDHYSAQAKVLGTHTFTHFVGSRPISELASCLAEADILLSPRVLGNNTPMKIYSYLGSEKPIVATKIESHTQVLNSDVAFLVDPEPEDFGRGILALVENHELRKRLGKAGRRLAELEFSLSAYRRRVTLVYDLLRGLFGRGEVEILDDIAEKRQLCSIGRKDGAAG